MSVTEEEVEFAKDLFSGLGPLTTRKMMGGPCICCHGAIFSIIPPHGGLMIKGKGAFVQELEDMGCEPWTYLRKDGSPTSMPYWHLPDDVLEDPDAACALARRALAHL